MILRHFYVTEAEVEREGAAFVQIEAYDPKGCFVWELRREDWIALSPLERDERVAAVVRTFLAGERSGPRTHATDPEAA